ncbi:hypothetical protein GCM10022226_62220 [Sphaerisporangium flaviroseum]|uniref:Uncharacterized protein n=1 Tax=Sphaerisporangium flaviroseum TaxID=509199 RepID=A0ABP7J1P8_9ACTN
MLALVLFRVAAHVVQFRFNYKAFRFVLPSFTAKACAIPELAAKSVQEAIFGGQAPAMLALASPTLTPARREKPMDDPPSRQLLPADLSEATTLIVAAVLAVAASMIAASGHTATAIRVLTSWFVRGRHHEAVNWPETRTVWMPLPSTRFALLNALSPRPGRVNGDTA